MIINITDFGTEPNNKSVDSACAINKAIEFAKLQREKVVINFENGEYFLKSVPDAERFMICCFNAKNITFKGNGSKLILTTPFSGVFLLRNCENIKIDGFKIEYQIPPWTQGIVEEVNIKTGEIIYVSEEGYDVFSMEGYTSYTAPWGVILNPENFHMLKPDAPEHFKFSYLEPLGNRRYKVKCENNDIVKNEILRKGDRLVYTCREMSGSVVAAFSSENITVQNMLVYECGDCLFVAAYVEGEVLIKNYCTKYHKNNYVVSVADGVHIQGSRAKVHIENCHFEGLLDDCVNLYQYPGKISQILSNTEIKLIMPEKNLPRECETIMIYNPETMEEKVMTKVKKVKNINDEHTECTVILEDELVSIKKGDTFCIADCMAPESVIKNNHFTYSRRYGLLLKSKDTLVDGNTFENLGADAVNFAANVSDFRKEGPFSENVTIQNNNINNVCYRNGRKHKNFWASGACIGIYKYNKNIRIYDNTFKNTPDYKISYGSEQEGIHIK